MSMPTTPERGYGYAHQQQRKRWQPIVQRGDGWCHAVVCLEQSRFIAPGGAWDLGHTPDRSTWTGPEHPSCNRSDGGRRRWAGASKESQPRSREW